MGVSVLALIRPKLPHRAAGSIIQSASPWPFRGKRWAAAWTCCRASTKSRVSIEAQRRQAADIILGRSAQRHRPRVSTDPSAKPSRRRQRDQEVRRRHAARGWGLGGTDSAGVWARRRVPGRYLMMARPTAWATSATRTDGSGDGGSVAVIHRFMGKFPRVRSR